MNYDSLKNFLVFGLTLIIKLSQFRKDKQITHHFFISSIIKVDGINVSLFRKP